MRTWRHNHASNGDPHRHARTLSTLATPATNIATPVAVSIVTSASTIAATAHGIGVRLLSVPGWPVSDGTGFERLHENGGHWILVAHSVSTDQPRQHEL